MTELERLQRLLRKGGITRRVFMGRAAALGVTTALASTMAGRALQAATPSKGGTLRMGIGHGSTSDTLDPATFLQTYTQFVGYGLRNHLAEVSNTNELAPELAESWEASEDAVTWAFKLRKGVEFHNGKTLDADDVVASFNHHRGEESKSAAKPLVEAIADIKADGKNTVVFTMKAGNADFPFITSDYHIAIMPADKDGKIDPNSGVGTGGYVLENFEPGVRTTLKRNPNYWKEDRAHFDSSEVLAILDGTARTNALTTGEIDVMDRVDVKTAHLLERDKKLRLEETSGTQQYTFAMRTDTAPFDNNDVRLALKYSVDREALIKTILRGHGSLGNDHPIGRSNRYHADLPQREYDVDKAKFHLKRADLSSLKIDLSAADAAFTGAVDAAVLYKEHAAKAGIEINVVREPNDGYWTNVWMQKPWSAVYWGGRITEDMMFSTAYASGAAWNDSFWEHDRFNELLVDARAELDDAKRRQIYFEMQSIVRDEGGVVIPMYVNYLFAMLTKVQHDESMSANKDLDGNKGMERWWFA